MKVNIIIKFSILCNNIKKYKIFFSLLKPFCFHTVILFKLPKVYHMCICIAEENLKRKKKKKEKKKKKKSSKTHFNSSVE